MPKKKKPGEEESKKAAFPSVTNLDQIRLDIQSQIFARQQINRLAGGGGAYDHILHSPTTGEEQGGLALPSFAAPSVPVVPAVSVVNPLCSPALQAEFRGYELPSSDDSSSVPNLPQYRTRAHQLPTLPPPSDLSPRLHGSLFHRMPSSTVAGMNFPPPGDGRVQESALLLAETLKRQREVEAQHARLDRGDISHRPALGNKDHELCTVKKKKASDDDKTRTPGASSDHSMEADSKDEGHDAALEGGKGEPFPEKLHRLLMEVEAEGKSDIISFSPNGRCFRIHKPDEFFQGIVPKYFKQTRLSSFKRQLNLYGFEMVASGPDKGGYFNENFVRGCPELFQKISRRDVKLKCKQSNRRPWDASAPDFYSMPPITSSEEAKALAERKARARQWEGSRRS